jgi:hypothetical protein
MPFGFAVSASALDPEYLPALLAHKLVLFLFLGLWIPGIAWTFRLVGKASSA